MINNYTTEEIYTPIVEMRNFPFSTSSKIFLKIEGCQISGSLKDRSANAIIAQAEKDDLLKPGDTIVESSSGNFAISLAYIAAKKGYKLICVVDNRITNENLKILRALGAFIESVAGESENGGFQKHRINKVKEILENTPNSFWPNQYSNKFNPKGFETLGKEIFHQMDGNLDYLVMATSTGGSISGCVKYLKSQIKTLKVLAVDAEGSALFGGTPKKHYLTGIGSSLVADVLDTSLIDGFTKVSDFNAINCARKLARQEGLLVGGSSGAVAYSAMEIARRNNSVRIVGILPDRGERYLDTIFNDNWFENKILKNHINQKETYPAMRNEL